MEPSVVVVGAGPVGLWLACELALADVPVLVVEREPERGALSKALGLHARTLEVLAMRGRHEPFLDEGTAVSEWHFGLLESRIDFRPLDTPYPYMLSFPQARTEQLFEDFARELGVRIHRGQTVTAIQQNTDCVTVETSETTVHTRYVVGCDGAGSTVRKAAGIPFVGTDASAHAILGEVTLDSPPAPGLPQWNNQGHLIVIPLGAGRHRIVAWDPTQRQSDTPLTLTELRATTLRLAGTDFGMRDPVWLSRFGNATRVAGRYRDGRVLLAGDAAHMQFPTGGVGLNVGIQDAMNLGWKLAAVAQLRAPETLLDTYHDERHPVGVALAENTMAQTALLTGISPEQRALRALLNEMIATQPEFALALAKKLTALDVTYPAGECHPSVGSRAPVGDAERLFALMHTGRPVVVAAPEMPLWDAVTAAVIRPDGHVWWATEDRVDPDRLVKQALAALPARFDLM
ncbi:FAD-dependent monooxygenase [Actinocrispum wychmicini]|uniref:2-polyprenyl-6-methoxyphenol hydroxylase-like FAD-dependent oxidoreductase n=1 Tax=Actinocrispum wychmicini TaxID=1213861 RepID=A0A4R2K835_9PSEU|nr:FAD-dependent monooxygenase [Actinocrispum wychmicini]TCO62525.1 2-polyprenyl-6-methoxyphenol hydroxylase-like FAD-dependent oxidoreductase [Actinocrispum wychmicini]